MKSIPLILCLIFVCSLAARYKAGYGKAYYILFADDINSSTWPSGFNEFSLFIAQPQNITSAMISKIHQDIPNSLVLAYWDFQHIPLVSGCSTGHVMGDLPGRNCSTYPTYHCGPGEYSAGIQKMGFNDTWLLAQLFQNGSRSTICTYPGLAGWVYMQESADIVANFLASWLQEVPFDGIYLDGTLNAAIYAQVAQSWLAPYPMFDCNGDGKPDTIPEMVAQYQSWFPYFISTLRKKLGESKILIGNSGGAISDPNLNGITIEMESCLDQESCLDALEGQYETGLSPSVSVMWLTHSEAMPPSEQCAQVQKFQGMMDWVLAGTDFFDGSHIICNYSTAL